VDYELKRASCPAHFQVDILPEGGHPEVKCLPKKTKTASNFSKALWTC
jgi:hypothetical protein